VSILDEQVIEEEVDGDRAARRMKLCRCRKCGTVERCTPRSDFYTVPNMPGLYCEGCFQSIALAKRPCS